MRRVSGCDDRRLAAIIVAASGIGYVTMDLATSDGARIITTCTISRFESSKGSSLGTNPGASNSGYHPDHVTAGAVLWCEGRSAQPRELFHPTASVV